MALIPAWLPNIHPVVVHFPIAVLPLAALVDLLSLFWRRPATLRDTATWLYLAGTGFALLAYFSGRTGVEAMTLSALIEPHVNAHENWAFRTTWFFAVFASLRLAVSYIFRPRLALLLAAFVLAVGGLFMLVQTAEHGAALVYQHGLGVGGSRQNPDR